MRPTTLELVKLLSESPTKYKSVVQALAEDARKNARIEYLMTILFLTLIAATATSVPHDGWKIGFIALYALGGLFSVIAAANYRHSARLFEQAAERVEWSEST